MKDTGNEILTVGVFEKTMRAFEERLSKKFLSIEAFERFEQKMHEGFEAVFDRFDRLETRMDGAEKGIIELNAKFDRIQVTKTA